MNTVCLVRHACPRHVIQAPDPFVVADPMNSLMKRTGSESPHNRSPTNHLQALRESASEAFSELQDETMDSSTRFQLRARERTKSLTSTAGDSKKSLILNDQDENQARLERKSSARVQRHAPPGSDEVFWQAVPPDVQTELEVEGDVNMDSAPQGQVASPAVANDDAPSQRGSRRSNLEVVGMPLEAQQENKHAPPSNRTARGSGREGASKRRQNSERAKTRSSSLFSCFLGIPRSPGRRAHKSRETGKPTNQAGLRSEFDNGGPQKGSSGYVQSPASNPGN